MTVVIIITFTVAVMAIVMTTTVAFIVTLILSWLRLLQDIL